MVEQRCAACGAALGPANPSREQMRAGEPFLVCKDWASCLERRHAESARTARAMRAAGQPELGL